MKRCGSKLCICKRCKSKYFCADCKNCNPLIDSITGCYKHSPGNPDKSIPVKLSKNNWNFVISELRHAIVKTSPSSIDLIRSKIADKIELQLEGGENDER